MGVVSEPHDEAWGTYRFRVVGPSGPTVSIVIPAINEAENLRLVLPTLPAVHEVILVDGNSMDDTVEAAREVMPDIRVLRQTRKGKGNALSCGFAAATGDVIVTFDGDGSAAASEIPRFVEALVAGADFAKGSRFIPGGGSDDITAIRRWGNACLHAVANLVFRTRFSDLCYGYNALWRDLVPTLGLPDNDHEALPNKMLWGDGFEVEAVVACRMAAARVNIIEVPSVELRRIFGQSNLRTFRDGTRVLRTILAERLGTSRRRAAHGLPDALSRRVPRR